MVEPVQTQSLEVDDFSGGKTDNYIAGSPNQFQDADNMVLKKYGSKAKLFTRPGSEIYDDTYYRISNADRVVCLMENESTLFNGSARLIETEDGEVTGPTGNHALSAGAITNYISWATWNKHLVLVNDALCKPVKVYDTGSGLKARTLGLPEIDTTSVSITPAAGANSYIYAFIRADSYTIGTVTFREVSAVSTKTCATAAAPNVSTIAITSLPVLANGATGNYNTTSSTIEIYRTTNGGSAFYYVGQVTNGTTSFNDTVSDTTLQTNASLYTEGGIVDFEQVDPAKYVVVTGDTAFYLGVQEGSATYGNRVRQSIPGALYASPRDFYVDLTAEITGGGSINTYPIVFCERRFYRIEGKFDEFGNGGLIAREVSNTVGCVSNRSIVQTPQGIYFAALDGFYFTDGFSVRKISGEFNESYAQIVDTADQRAMIYGAYDSLLNRVWWAAQADTTSNDNDIIFVAHCDAPNHPFTTLSGGYETDNFQPSALLFFNNEMIRGDRRGYLFRHVDTRTTDPLIDTTTTPSNWATAAIIYDYRSCAYDFGTTNVRKWVPRIVVNAENSTNLSLMVSSNNDNSGVFSELSEIKYSNNIVWGDEDAVWGDDNLRWDYSAVIAHWRRMPSPLRKVYQQVRMTNSSTVIETYELLGTCSTDTTANTVTLDDATKSWTANAVGYVIAFDNDDYDREWEITERTSDTVLALDDSDSSLTTASARNFKVRGYKKGEVFNLLSYVIDYALLTQTQTTFRSQTA